MIVFTLALYRSVDGRIAFADLACPRLPVDELREWSDVRRRYAWPSGSRRCRVSGRTCRFCARALHATRWGISRRPRRAELGRPFANVALRICDRQFFRRWGSLVHGRLFAGVDDPPAAAGRGAVASVLAGGMTAARCSRAVAADRTRPLPLVVVVTPEMDGRNRADRCRLPWSVAGDMARDKRPSACWRGWRRGRPRVGGAESPRRLTPLVRDRTPTGWAGGGGHDLAGTISSGCDCVFLFSTDADAMRRQRLEPGLGGRVAAA